MLNLCRIFRERHLDFFGKQQSVKFSLSEKFRKLRCIDNFTGFVQLSVVRISISFD